MKEAKGYDELACLTGSPGAPGRRLAAAGVPERSAGGGITDWPRLRVNFNGSIKREIITDFTVNFSIFDSYDSDPSSETAVANHDFGVILSVGWTF